METADIKKMAILLKDIREGKHKKPEVDDEEENEDDEEEEDKKKKHKIEIEVSEGKVKELKKNQIIKKMKDGQWESDEDIVSGRYATITDLNTGEKFQVYVKEEEAEELEELSKKTLKSYIKKAQDDANINKSEAQRNYRKADKFGAQLDKTQKNSPRAKTLNKVVNDYEDKGDKSMSKYKKRRSGIKLASRKMSTRLAKEEKAKNPYAIGMAKAMKDTGDKPPLKKSTITKAHKIAKSIKNESVQKSSILERYKQSLKVKELDDIDTKEKAPEDLDIDKILNKNKKAEKKSVADASKSSVKEGYAEYDDFWVNQLNDIAKEVYDLTTKIKNNHLKTRKLEKKKTAIIPPIFYNAKNITRSLEDVRDELVKNQPPTTNIGVKETGVVENIKHALTVIRERDEQYKGATKPEQMDSKMSGLAKRFLKIHKVDTPDEVDIEKITDANHKEISNSLQRSVKYRKGDQTKGDKKPIGNDGK